MLFLGEGNGISRGKFLIQLAGKFRDLSTKPLQNFMPVYNAVEMEILSDL